MVLVPTYRSFLDIFVLLYTLYEHEIPIPFTFGNLDDTPRINIVDPILRNIGYILTKRSHDQSLQSSYLNFALLREIIDVNQFTMVFQNETRQRSGKFNHPIRPDIAV